MRYLYLHGFASGAQSRKAEAFGAAFAKAGVSLEVPDLAEGNFETLTFSSQLAVIERTLGGEEARVIGSSMGGYLAALYAKSHSEVDRLVLLAPAFHFTARWSEMAGPERMASWRETGWQEVFHYSENAMRRVHYGLYEDSRRYEPAPDFEQPVRIFHGIRDETVPIEYSQAFAASHPSAVLTEMDSDHGLVDVLDEIVAAAIPFLMAA